MKSGCYVIHDASTLLDVASSTRCGNYPRAFCAKETKQLTPCGSVSTVCTASLRKSAEPASCHGGRPRSANRFAGRVKAVCRSAVASPKMCFAARRPAIHYKNHGEPPISHFCAGIRNWRFIGRGPSPVARGPRVTLRPTWLHVRDPAFRHVGSPRVHRGDFHGPRRRPAGTGSGVHVALAVGHGRVQLGFRSGFGARPSAALQGACRGAVNALAPAVRPVPSAGSS